MMEAALTACVGDGRRFTDDELNGSINELESKIQINPKDFINIFIKLIMYSLNEVMFF